MKNIIFLILICISSYNYAQNVSIVGIAKGDEGSLVRVIGYEDLFSNREKTIAQTKVDDNGNFKLNLNIDQTAFVYLALNLDRGEFYITPDGKYSFNIVQDTSQNFGSIFDQLPLTFELKSEDSGIEEGIGNFNMLYNEFIYNNIKSIYSSRDKSVVKNFIYKIEEEYKNENSKYITDYVTYSLISLRWLSKVENNTNVLQKYIINKPVLYNNIQYCDFFKEFFKNYFDSEQLFRYEDIVPALNSKDGIQSIKSLISRDSLLNEDSRVSEIVSMLLMSRYYFDRYVEKGAVISKLQQISNDSEFPENQIIASNYIVSLQKLQNGTPAPQIELGAADILEDHKGKFLLLAFVDNNCPMCTFHMQQLEDMRQKLGFDIVTIVADDDNSEIYNLALERNYNWPIVSIENNILLMEDYNVKVFPTYIFINPDGTIAYVHLPMPTENMELYLTRFMQKYDRGE